MRLQTDWGLFSDQPIYPVPDYPLYRTPLSSLKELVRSYLTITKDLGRVMSRVKAINRSWTIPCTGKQVYASRNRAEWLAKINEPGVRSLGFSANRRYK